MIVTEPQPGDVLLVRTRGRFGAAIMLGTRSRVSHAAVHLGDGVLMEARPGGAGLAEVADYDGVPAVWVSWPMTPEQRAAVVERAEAFEGTPYGWDDIAAISASCLGLRGGIVRRVLKDRGSVICSQLAAVALAAGSVRVAGGKDPSYVTPGDLLDDGLGLEVPPGW